MVLIGQFSSRSSESSSKGLKSRVRELEEKYANLLMDRGYREVLNPHTLSERDLELQEIDEDGYIKTKRGLIPLQDSSRWLPTLECVSNNLTLPIKLFSSSMSLFNSFNFSVVVVDNEVDLNEMKRISNFLLSDHDFSIGYKRDVASSPLSKSGDILLNEDNVGEYGLYSLSTLSNFGIEDPVGYLRLDLASVLASISSLSSRKSLYPQLTGVLSLTDEALAKSVSIDKVPLTEFGKAVKKKISKEITKERVKGTRGRSKLLETSFKDRVVQVWVLNEGGTTSKGLFNEIYAWNGGLYTVPRTNITDALKKVKEEGSSTGIHLVDAVASRLAWEAEHMSGDRKLIELEDIDSIESANITLPRNLRSSIDTSNLKGEIDLELELKLSGLS